MEIIIYLRSNKNLQAKYTTVIFFSSAVLSMAVLVYYWCSREMYSSGTLAPCSYGVSDRA